MSTAAPDLPVSRAIAEAVRSGRSLLVAILGSTATGKSSLGLALCERYDGEVISCDSTAVYRGLDIGTDKLEVPARRGIPHHLIDVVECTSTYTAADYARDASGLVRAIRARRALPVLVGGTGFYYRALTRGLFPGPGRDPALRARIERVASRRGVGFLHRMVARVDPPSARRIQQGDRMRLIRALEVYFKTGRPLTAHFADTVSSLDGYEILPVALRLPRATLEERVRRRVDEQFSRGLLDEVRRLIGSGVPETAHCFTGLVYRQAIEYLNGIRDLAETRALIVRENVRYARRQLIWFRKEPNLVWVDGAGESQETLRSVERALEATLSAPGRHAGRGMIDGSVH